MSPFLIENGTAIEFVRFSSSDGLENTGSMFKVKYILENGTLNRYVSNFLNSPYSSNPLTLISDVSEIEIQKPLSSSFSSFEPENIPKLLKFNIKIGEVFFKKIFIVSNA